MGMDAGVIGKQALLLGAGRETAGSAIDHAVGFDRIRKIGDEVRVGDTLLRVHAPSLESLKEAASNLRNAVTLS